MAVYKSKRGESSVQFIETARQLEAHTLACCMKCPKRYSFLLTQRRETTTARTTRMALRPASAYDLHLL